MSPVCLFFLFAVSWLNPSYLKAQNTVQIVHADNITGGTVHGIRVQKILGNVHLKTPKMDMYADSAYKFNRKNMIKAFGNIEIDTKKQSIWADTLTYYTNTNFCKLRGRVIIASDSTTLFGEKVNYHFGTEIAHFLDQIRLEDSQGVLIANKGYFYRKADSAVFRGDVQLKDSLKYLEGDSLFSNRRSGYYELYGQVYGKDPANNSKLSGDYLQSDSSGLRVVKGHALLMNYKNNSDKGDSLKTDSLRLTESVNGHQTVDSLHTFRVDSVHTARHDTSKASQPDTTYIFAYKIISIAHRTPKDTTTTIKAFSSITNSSHLMKPVSSHQTSDSLHVFSGDSVRTARHDTSKTSQPDTTNNLVHKTIPIAHQTQKDTTSATKPSSPTTNSLHLTEPVSSHQTSDSLHVFSGDSVRTARHDTSKTSQPDTTNNLVHKTIPIAHQAQKDTTSISKTFKKVRVWSTKFSSISDSAKYNSKLHTFELWSNAKSWHNNIQLTGPYIRVKLQNGDIKKLVSSPNPFVVQQDTSINRLNQMKGDSLTSIFTNSQLHFIRIRGNGHLLRFTQEGDSADGMIEVQAPLTKIFFSNGKLVKMKAFGEKKQVTGHYLPKSEQTANTKLDGFAWNPDQRPQKPDEKMHRRLPPIPENPPFKLPKRYLKYIHRPAPTDSSSIQNIKKMKGAEVEQKTNSRQPYRKSTDSIILNFNKLKRTTSFPESFNKKLFRLKNNGKIIIEAYNHMLIELF